MKSFICNEQLNKNYSFVMKDFIKSFIMNNLPSLYKTNIRYMMKDLLKRIISEQQDSNIDIASRTIPRTIENERLETDEVFIISGIRRCGKGFS